MSLTPEQRNNLLVIAKASAAPEPAVSDEVVEAQQIAEEAIADLVALGFEIPDNITFEELCENAAILLSDPTIMEEIQKANQPLLERAPAPPSTAAPVAKTATAKRPVRKLPTRAQTAAKLAAEKEAANKTAAAATQPEKPKDTEAKKGPAPLAKKETATQSAKPSGWKGLQKKTASAQITPHQMALVVAAHRRAQAASAGSSYKPHQGGALAGFEKKPGLIGKGLSKAAEVWKKTKAKAKEAVVAGKEKVADVSRAASIGSQSAKAAYKAGKA